MTFGLDTSVVLRLLTGQPPDLADKALARYQDGIAAGDDFSVSDLVAAESYYAIGELAEPADVDEQFPDPTDKVFYCTAFADDAHLVTGNMKHYPRADFVVTPAQFCDLAGI